MSERTYICIDLKSFYASAECVARGLDPLKENLVVADESRTDKTICLAVSPTLKSFGISGRPRLFEVRQKVREINRRRLYKTKTGRFTGLSANIDELEKNPDLELAFHIAVPRMAEYIAISSGIYQIYLKYIAPEDIHVYSIDEVFIDATGYLKTYGMSGHELAMAMIRDVLRTTGITATAGIGTNMYLAKVAMDIVAKHIPADEDGVRIAELDEISYREKLWEHTPLTDFWRVGRGTVRRLEEAGLHTMGDIAVCSAGDPSDRYNAELLYQLFGINAELLIDHAWGYEPCTMADIKAYKPDASSISSGQVLAEGYEKSKAKIIIREMAESLILDLVDHGLKARGAGLALSYDSESFETEGAVRETGKDYYGRTVPKGTHGAVKFDVWTDSRKKIMDALLAIFEQKADPALLIRRINLSLNDVLPAGKAEQMAAGRQISLFDTPETEQQEEDQEKELNALRAVLQIRKKYGRNAVLKGTDLEEGATGRERNAQIGGHKA